MHKALQIQLTALALLMVASCEKEEPDYREKYTGDFHFTTVVESWHLNTDTASGMVTVVNYDTFEYNGFIRFYEPEDEAIDLYSEPDPLLYPPVSLFIQFREHACVTTELKKDGSFEPRSGYHYNCGGAFIGKDSLAFSVNGLGGMGAGQNYEVTGSRK